MSAPMQAGKLRRWLTILSDTQPTPGAYGEQQNNDTVVLATWDKVTVKPGNALIAALAGQQMAQSQYIIEIRYPPSITISPGMRVQDGRKTYRIHQVGDVEERHRTLLLSCVEEPAS